MRAGRCEGACGRTISGTFRRLLHSARWRTLGDWRALAGTGGHWTGTVGRQAVVQARPDQARACRAGQGRAGQTEQGGSQAGTGHWAGSRGGRRRRGERERREREGGGRGRARKRRCGDAAAAASAQRPRAGPRSKRSRDEGWQKARVWASLPTEQARSFPRLLPRPVLASERGQQPASPVSTRRRGPRGQWAVGSGQWAPLQSADLDVFSFSFVLLPLPSAALPLHSTIVPPSRPTPVAGPRPSFAPSHARKEPNRPRTARLPRAR